MTTVVGWTVLVFGVISALVLLAHAQFSAVLVLVLLLFLLLGTLLTRPTKGNKND